MSDTDEIYEISDDEFIPGLSSSQLLSSHDHDGTPVSDVTRSDSNNPLSSLSDRRSWYPVRDEEEFAAVTPLLRVQSLFNSPNGRRDGSKTRSLWQKGEASSHGNFKSLKASNPDGARTGCTLKE
jgi:hypothetical protein